MTTANIMLYAIFLSLTAFFVPVGVGIYRNTCIDAWSAGKEYRRFELHSRTAWYLTVFLTFIMMFCGAVALGEMRSVSLEYMLGGAFMIAIASVIAIVLFGVVMQFLWSLLFLVALFGVFGLDLQWAAPLGIVAAALLVIHTRACKIHLMQ